MLQKRRFATRRFHFESSNGSKVQANPWDIGIFYAVMLALAAFGGSSRYDLMQVAILQPILWLGLGIAVFRLRTIEGYWSLVGLIVAYGIWLVLQLIPLPFNFWSDLPGRAVIAQADLAVGGEMDRPFSLVPARTLHALGYFPALLAPLVAAINLGEGMRKHVLLSIVAIAVLSGFIGLLQILTGELYFYAITNPDRMVGLFANANHNAVFGSFAMGICAACLAVCTSRWVRQTCYASAIALFLLMVANGSRAGLVSLLMATIILLMVLALTRSASSTSEGKPHQLPASLLGGVLLLILAGGAFFITGNIGGLEDLARDEALADLRFVINPLSLEMASAYFPAGSGVGTFEDAFYIFESDDILGRNYINMAHNDWLQVVIEGGLVAIVLLVGLFYIAVAGIWRFGAVLVPEKRKAFWLAAAGIFGIVAFASAFDYPLRTPLFQGCAIILIATMVTVRRHGASEDF